MGCQTARHGFRDTTHGLRAAKPWVSYTDGVPEFWKGTTPDSEMQALDEAYAKCIAAIQAWPDPVEAWDYTVQLGQLIARKRTETADFRAFLAAFLQDHHGMSDADLAVFMGDISLVRVRQIIKRARERGNPVTNPATLPTQPAVVLAVITSSQGVLVADRVDKVPPLTFPGGDMLPGESPSEAASRRVLVETGLNITKWEFIGQRIHDATSRHMIYVRAETDETELNPGDPEDLSNVRWATVAEANAKMPTMYQGARDFLNEWAREA